MQARWNGTSGGFPLSAARAEIPLVAVEVGEGHIELGNPYALEEVNHSPRPVFLCVHFFSRASGCRGESIAGSISVSNLQRHLESAVARWEAFFKEICAEGAPFFLLFFSVIHS